MSKINKIHAREILDSRGNPTIEVEVWTKKGAHGRASIPSGASTGEREAIELRDKDENRYDGKGVLKAVDNVNHILSQIVIGKEVTNQREIDEALIREDGTFDKSKYGANAILGISLAVCHAAANEEGKKLYQYLENQKDYKMPIPMINILNGGSHADNSVDFQEYMIMPIHAKSMEEAIRIGSEIFHALKEILKENKEVTAVGDEGGFAPNLKDNEEPLKYIMEAIKKRGYIPGKDVSIALDVAASEFYNKESKCYELKKSGGGNKTTLEMIEWYKELITKYPIISIEDGLSERDEDGWIKLTQEIGDKIQLVGDDLFVTNPTIFKSGIEKHMANAILIKLNQIGTVSETIDTIKMAYEHGYRAIISHRSGETEDTSIAHFAVAFQTGQIKTGSMSRSERICKYNELKRIEEELGSHAIYNANEF